MAVPSDVPRGTQGSTKSFVHSYERPSARPSCSNFLYYLEDRLRQVRGLRRCQPVLRGTSGDVGLAQPGVQRLDKRRRVAPAPGKAAAAGEEKPRARGPGLLCPAEQGAKVLDVLSHDPQTGDVRRRRRRFGGGQPEQVVVGEGAKFGVGGDG